MTVPAEWNEFLPWLLGLNLDDLNEKRWTVNSTP